MRKYGKDVKGYNAKNGPGGGGGGCSTNNWV